MAGIWLGALRLLYASSSLDSKSLNFLISPSISDSIFIVFELPAVTVCW